MLAAVYANNTYTKKEKCKNKQKLTNMVILCK